MKNFLQKLKVIPWMKENEKTELQLLLIAITAESGTKTAFAKKIGKSRQALNDIIKKAKERDGKLNPRFVQELEKIHNVDIYKWRPNPTLDFHSQNELESISTQEITTWSTGKLIEHLRIENEDLRERLKECESSLHAKKNKGHRSA